MVIRLEGRYAYFFYDAHMAAYGLGWFLHDHYGTHVVAHGGAIDGMRSEVAFLPEQKRGVVILTNLEDTLLPTAIKNRLLDHWSGRPPRDWSGDLLAVYRQLSEARERDARARSDRRQKGTQPSQSASAFAGSYLHPFYGAAKVVEAPDGMRLRFTPTMQGDLTHWQHDSFQIRWDDERAGTGFASFNSDADGRVVELVLEGIGTFSREP
jgi:hypothetical protein